MSDDKSFGEKWKDANGSSVQEVGQEMVQGMKEILQFALDHHRRRVQAAILRQLETLKQVATGLDSHEELEALRSDLRRLLEKWQWKGQAGILTEESETEEIEEDQLEGLVEESSAEEGVEGGGDR